MKLIKLIAYILNSIAFLFCFINAVGCILLFEPTTQNRLDGIGLALLAIIFLLQQRWMNETT